MAHIYTNRETRISLWQDNYNSETPFVIKKGKDIIAEIDTIGVAYRLYNQFIRKFQETT